jgi:hypothetical protein
MVVGTGMTEPLRPWLPPTLARRGFTAETVGILSYVLLDEIVDDDVTFLVHPWPVADELGRVRFAEPGHQVELSVSREQVRRELYRRSRRRPRIGDVFACAVRLEVMLRPENDGLVDIASAVADGVVYDISAEARLMTKLAYYGSLTAVVPRGTAEDWKLPAPETDPRGPARELRIGPNR